MKPLQGYSFYTLWLFQFKSKWYSVSRRLARKNMIKNLISMEIKSVQSMNQVQQLDSANRSSRAQKYSRLFISEWSGNLSLTPCYNARPVPFEVGCRAKLRTRSTTLCASKSNHMIDYLLEKWLYREMRSSTLVKAEHSIVPLSLQRYPGGETDSLPQSIKMAEVLY